MDDKKEPAIIVDQYAIEREEEAAQRAKRELIIAPENATVFEKMISAAHDLDPTKLQQLQDMYFKQQDREAERRFAEDFAKMQPDLPRILRKKKNTQTNSNYAPLEDINEQINPILKQYNFGLSFQTIEQNEAGVKVKTILRHKDGHKEETIVFIPIDNKGMAGTVNKTMPHAYLSSIMYARRGGACMLLNISTGDDNDGNLLGDTIPDEIVEVIKQKVMQFEPEYSAKFLKYMKAETIEAILAKDTKRAFTALEQKRKAFEAEQSKKGNDNAK